ncbi:hypothetical protein N1851_030133 [Merluccius polli]|uniref:Uncharacterized protein n=1 Tax=Merluccius polli TaxID=89951 RepID=A0AA47M6D6_MERPO|nr:hypothetical protein N1851_030133 [Merluccius polli]
MATQRRMLVFKIQRRLSELNNNQLQAVANEIDDGQQTKNVEELDEPELYDLIVDYLRSEKLKALEDEGMAQLLTLEDLLDDLLCDIDLRASATDHTGSHPVEDPDPPTQPPAPSTADTTARDSPRHLSALATDDIIHLPTMFGDLHTNPPTEDRDTPAPAKERDPTTPILIKSSLIGTGGAPRGRMSSSSADQVVSDDFLLEHITKSTSEEEGRFKRLSVAKTRPVTVSAAQHDSNEQTDQTKQTKLNKVDSELQANRAAINELTVQVSSLTKHLAQMVKPTENLTRNPSIPVTQIQSPATQTQRGRCNDCVQKGNLTCPHCFICSQAGHRAIGCLQRKLSGNGMRSLERGKQ